MLVADLRTKSKDELNNLIGELKAELFMLRFKNSTGQLEQPHKIALVKKDIAKVFTVLNGKNPGPTKVVAKKTVAKKATVKKAPVKAEEKPVAAKPAAKVAAKPAVKKEEVKEGK